MMLKRLRIFIYDNIHGVKTARSFIKVVQEYFAGKGYKTGKIDGILQGFSTDRPRRGT